MKLNEFVDIKMKAESEVIKNFLNEIIPSIQIIDGGCFDCIDNFIEDVNESLEKHSLKLVCSDKYPIKVTIEESLKK